MKKHTLLFVFILCYISSFGQIEKNITIAIDEIFSEWNQPNTPGCALGVIINGELMYSRGYGLANMEYDIPNSASSVFRIGSTSKQFTAACIILLAEKKKLNLNNSLDQYFPDFPKYAKKITVRHLLNHTSGIRDYLTISSLKGLGNDDYYEDKEIMKWLTNQNDLNFSPGDEFLYSNSGYWLLGQIVMEVTGMNMADFAQKEIFMPLGMSNTHFHNDHTEIVKNRASGYYPISDSSYQISMTTLDMIGDGGIFTSINDILKWDNAYYDSDVLNETFWKMMTQQGKLNSGEEIDYACGLFVDEYKGLKTISHGGAFVGFRADIIRFPEQGVSIVVFANRGDANPSRKVRQVADLILKDKFPGSEFERDERVDLKEPIEPSVTFSIDQMTGNYEVRPGMILKISAKNDSLKVIQSWNNADYMIGMTTINTFQMSGNSNLSFMFSLLEDGLTQILVVNQGGHESTCKRKNILDQNNVNLTDYIGHFYSNELDVTYSFFMEGKELKVRIRNLTPFDLTVSDLDEFYWKGNLIRFKRTKGSISGFELDAGRVINLKFEKQ